MVAETVQHQQTAEYVTRTGWRLSDDIANQVGQFADKLAARIGRRPEPSELVTAAKSVRSPIHDLFEWDDAKAGHAFRLSRAKQLLASYRLKGSDIPFNMVLDPLPSETWGEDGNSIRRVTLTQVFSDDELAHRAKLTVFRRVYFYRSQLVEFADGDPMIDAVVKALDRCEEAFDKMRTV